MTTTSTRPIPYRRWMPALLFALALITHFLRLLVAPPGVSGDASRLGIWVQDFLYRGAWPFYVYHLFSPGPLMLYLQAVVFGTFGFNLVAMKAITALTGALYAPTAYVMLGEMYAGHSRHTGHRAGLIAGVGMALTPFMTQFSHYGTETSLLPLFELLVIAFLWRSLRRGQWPDFALTGVLLGLSQYSYIVSRFFPVALAFSVLVALAADWRSIWRHWRGLLITGFSAALVALPQWLMFIRYPYTFTARTSQQAGRFIWTVENAGQIFWQKVGHQLLALGWTWETPYYFTDAPGRPLLTPVLAVSLLAGVIVVIARRRARGLFLLAVTLGMLALDLITYEGLIPSATRLLSATVFVFSLSGLGGAALWRWLDQWRGVPVRLGPAILILVALFGLESQIYFSIIEVPKMYAIPGFEWRTSQVEIIEDAIIGRHEDKKILIPTSETQRAPLAFLLADRYPVRQGGWPIPLEVGERVLVIQPDDPTRPTTEGPPGDYVPGAWTLLHDGTATYLPPVDDAIIPVGEEERFYASNGSLVVHAYEAEWTGAQADPQPLDIVYKNGMRITGVEVHGDPLPGETIVVTIFWQTDRRLTRDVEIFVQVLDTHEQNRVGLHTWPLHGAYRVRVWTPGGVVPISYRLTLPEDLAPGDYHVIAGVFDLIGRTRIPTTTSAPYAPVHSFTLE